jgi:hypothetical protein
MNREVVAVDFTGDGDEGSSQSAVCSGSSIERRELILWGWVSSGVLYREEGGQRGGF